MKLLVNLFLLTNSLNILLETWNFSRDFQNYRTNYQNKGQYRTLLPNTGNTGRNHGRLEICNIKILMKHCLCCI